MLNYLVVIRFHFSGKKTKDFLVTFVRRLFSNAFKLSFYLEQNVMTKDIVYLPLVDLVIHILNDC